MEASPEEEEEMLRKEIEESMHSEEDYVEKATSPDRESIEISIEEFVIKDTKKAEVKISSKSEEKITKAVKLEIDIIETPPDEIIKPAKKNISKKTKLSEKPIEIKIELEEENRKRKIKNITKPLDENLNVTAVIKEKSPRKIKENATKEFAQKESEDIRLIKNQTAEKKPRRKILDPKEQIEKPPKESIKQSVKEIVREQKHKATVKDKLRNVLDKFKKKRAETVKETTKTGTKESIKRIIERERELEEKEELKKLQMQIFEIIDSNPNILNKEFIKGKIRDVIVKEAQIEFEDKEEIKVEEEVVVPEEVEDLNLREASLEMLDEDDFPQKYEDHLGGLKEEDDYDSEYNEANEQIDNIMTMISEIINNVEEKPDVENAEET